LPNSKDLIPPRYQDIRTAIIEEMNEQPLTPTYEKSHAPAKLLLQAKASLKELLSKDDLEFLVDFVNEPPQWASGAQQGTNIERFMSGLAINDWDIEHFVELLNKKASIDGRSIPHPPYYANEPEPEFMSWLLGKSVDWHQEMYALLYNDYLSKGAWQSYGLKQLRIIRLSNGDYSVGRKCFFPGDGLEQNDVLPRVDIKTYTVGKKKAQQEQAKKFLEESGVREVGEAEHVEAILKKRYMETDLQPLKKDLKRFISLLEKNPDKAGLFTSYFIFECRDGKWRKPCQIFIDQPLMETGVSVYYNSLGQGKKRFALAESYKDCGVAIKRLVKFAESVGVKTRLEISKTTCRLNPEKKYLYAAGGERCTSPIDEDYVIEGIDKLLEKPTIAISRLIWETMRSLPDYPNCLKARFRRNQTGGYHYANSQLVHCLKAAAWVPQTDGLFVSPAEAVRDLLPEGFAFDQGWEWLKSINFGDMAVKKSDLYHQKQSYAQSEGFKSAEELDKFKQARDAGFNPDAWLAENAQRQRITQPEDSVQDPARRQKKILSNTADAPTIESVKLERSIQQGISEVKAQAKAYLRAKYKNADGQLVCQCCHMEMPFKLGSGEHFFEAVQCIRDKEKRHFQNRLALCPACAAMYQFARETSDTEICRSVIDHKADDKASAIEIPIRLAGRELMLRFVGTHWFDLKTILSHLF
jgi:hypothetical protein